MNELPVMPIRAKYADESANGVNIDEAIEGIIADVDTLETTVGDSSAGLVKQVADLEEAVVAKGFIGTATIVKPSDFALSELPTEVGFYKVNSSYQGYQGFMYVQAVGEHTSGYGMCANGKYYSFEDSVDLTMKDSFEFDGVVRIIQTGGSTYGIKVPGPGVYLVKSVPYGVGPGAGILYSSTPAAAGTQLIQGITVDGKYYSFTGQLGSTVNIEFKPIATKLYIHQITLSDASTFPSNSTNLYCLSSSNTPYDYSSLVSAVNNGTLKIISGARMTSNKLFLGFNVNVPGATTVTVLYLDMSSTHSLTIQEHTYNYLWSDTVTEL